MGRAVFTACVLAFLALNILGALSPYMLNYDEGTYWQALRLMSAGHKLYTEIFYSQFPPFIEWANLFYRWGGQTLPAARLATLFCSALGLVAAFSIGQFFERRERLPHLAWYFFLLMLTDTVYFHLSHQLLGDASALAIFLVAVAFALQAFTRPRMFIWTSASGIVAGIAVLMKAVVLPLFFFLALIWVWVGRDRRQIWCPLLSGGLGFLLTFFGSLLASGYFSSGGFAQLQGGTVQRLLDFPARSTLAFRVTVFFTHAGGHFVYGNLLLPVFALFAILALFRYPRLRAYARSFAAALILIGGILLWYKNVNIYHFVICTPLFALPIAMFAAANRGGRMVTYLLLGINISLIAASFFFAGEYPLLDSRRQEIERALRACTSPAAQVISDDIFAVTAADRQSPPPLADISRTRLHFGSVTCETLKPWLISPGVEAVVFSTHLNHIDCGEAAFLAQVKKEFPVEALNTPFAQVYVRKSCATRAP